MYNLVSAQGFNPSTNRWSSVDLTSLTMINFYSTYSEGFAILTNQATGATQYSFDLNTVRAQYAGFNQTFSHILSGLGNATLATSSTIPTITTQYAIWSDAYRSQFKTIPINPNVSPGTPIPEEDKDWLMCTKAGIDYNLLFSSCLVSVNGLFHFTDTDGQALYVVDGQKTCRHSGRNQAGFYSFRQVGALTFVQITSGMIHKRLSSTPYSDTMYIKIPTPQPGKTAMLVLGGYLHVLDDRVFYQVSEDIFAISFQNYPLRDRYFESVDIIDLSSLGLSHVTTNPYRISDAELHSDQVLMNYAQLSQSFLVFVDNPALFVQRPSLADTVIPNTYTSYTEPMYPLLTGVGKISEYWKIAEDGQWSLTVSDGIRTNYVFNTVTSERFISIDNHAEPNEPYSYSQVNWLIVGSDIKTP